MSRKGLVSRKTKETEIFVSLNLDGQGNTQFRTGVPFLEHMLDLLAKHGRFDLEVDAKGDIEIDDHHTVEDIAICLGQAIQQAVGDKRGIRRYGNSFVPMDESLGQAIIDLSNRPHLQFRAEFPTEQVGTFATELVHEFFWKLALESRMTLHLILHYGENTHHMIESLFKAFARALAEAILQDGQHSEIPSSKGVL